MRRQQGLMKQILNWADLKMETVPGVPIVELASDERLLIEHHDGVTAYECTEIMVKVRYGMLQILGNHMEIQQMSKERLLICGTIEGIILHRRSGK